MHHEIIYEFEDFDKLKEKYNELLRQNSINSPFITHRWIKCWWRAYELKYKFCIFCYYHKNELIAALPLVFWDDRTKKIQIKKVCIIGTLWMRLIDLPGTENNIWCYEFLKWLYSSNAPKWELLILGPFEEECPNAQRLLNSLDDKSYLYDIDRRVNYYLHLQYKWQDYLKTKSRNFRRKIKKYENKVAELGKLEKKRINNCNKEIFEKTIYEVSKYSWQGEKGRSISSTAEGRKFYEYIASSKGDFEFGMNVINLNDNCLSYAIDFTKNKICHGFDAGFNHQYNKLSLGFLTITDVIKSIYEDCDEFNFGYNVAYKMKYSGDERNHIRILVYRSKIKGKIRQVIRKIK
jgi:CelD/BcsL family acetyltransferase involved in cellulose biosynthesis